MTKVLVTGAGGFVGANLMDTLAARGADAVGFDVHRGALADGVPMVEGSILDRGALDAAMEGVEVVAHLAVSSLRTSISDPALNVKVNVEGTALVLEVARESGVRKVVYPSASSVYGPQKTLPVGEDAPKSPSTVYGVGKYAAEELVRVYQTMHDLEYFVFRFANVYGPLQHVSTGGVVPVLLDRMHQGKSVFVHGDGSQTRDFVFVEDVVDFVATTVERGDLANETVNLGSGLQSRISEVLELCAQTLQVEPVIEHRPQESGERLGFQADVTRCLRIFGRTPSTALREGLAKTARWFEESVWAAGESARDGGAT